MKKPSEILGNLPLIGAYIRFEKTVQERADTAWTRYKNSKSLSDKARERLRATPYIGAVIRFPGALREWLEDVPVLGALVFRPCFAATSLLYQTLVARPSRFLSRAVIAPLAAAGMVSATLHANPDMASDTLDDYLRLKGIDAAVFEGIDHRNIRIYHDNVLAIAFHGAARQTALKYGMAGKESGPLAQAFIAAVQYPAALVSMGTAAMMPENAFTIPVVGEDGICFIRTLGEDVDPLEMISLLSGIPQRHLTIDRAALSRWLPLMVLGHEGKHCDNAKKTLAATEAMLIATAELQALRAEKLLERMEAGEDTTKALETLEDDAAIKEAARTVALKNRDVQRLTLEGETGSDIHIVAALNRRFPQAEIPAIMTHARAVQPFIGNMTMPNDHATASGLDSHIRAIEGSGPFDVWDAIDMGKFLIRFGAFLNTAGAPASGFDKTVENYHIAREIVIPYLERNRDAYLPRDERHVRFALVLDQVRLFVEGMDHLVKPEVLAQNPVLAPVAIPDLPARRPQPQPAPAR